MGCDIHIAIQRQEGDGTWREVIYQDELYDFQKEQGDKPVDGIPVAPRVFHGRNYDLFAILANVRNGRGFAGIKTGDGWPSIASDRGWPSDFIEPAPNPAYLEDGPRYMGDHSFTWISLDELKAFDWDGNTSTLCGVVSAKEYEKLKGEPPESYCAGVDGPGIFTYTESQYLNAKLHGALAPKPHVRVEWQESARSATYDWPGKVIPWLEQLAGGRPLRLILGFDS
jgi:hypothetical protein